MMHRLWSEQDGQDIAEYAVMIAVILVLVAGSRVHHATSFRHVIPRPH